MLAFRFSSLSLIFLVLFCNFDEHWVIAMLHMTGERRIIMLTHDRISHKIDSSRFTTFLCVFFNFFRALLSILASSMLLSSTIQWMEFLGVRPTFMRCAIKRHEKYFFPSYFSVNDWHLEVCMRVHKKKLIRIENFCSLLKLFLISLAPAESTIDSTTIRNRKKIKITLILTSPHAERSELFCWSNLSKYFPPFFLLIHVNCEMSAKNDRRVGVERNCYMLQISSLKLAHII